MSRATKYLTPVKQTACQPFSDVLTDTPVSIAVLHDILRRPRFAGTEGEQYVIDTYLMPLPGAKQDDYGNIWVQVGDEPPTTMFSSHTDTVHKKSATGTYKLAARSTWLSRKDGGVLGADCGSGIWIMLNLIKAEVPGLYIFHREEEIGGTGSSYIAAHSADKLNGIQHCIAFDRKDTSHIITHQAGGRCCSDAFADAFAQQLNLGTGFKFAGNDGGSFTDSANYTSIIPECTNLSVGYYDQHTQDECQDMGFLTALVVKLINVDYSQLPAERDPNVQDEWGWYYDRYNSGATTSRGAVRHNFDTMITVIKDQPDFIADMMEQMGYDLDGLLWELERTYDVDVSQYREGSQ